MRNQRPLTISQLLATGVIAMAVLVMLAPLRPGPAGMQSRQAGFVPLLNASGVADTAAFHRLAVSGASHAASAKPLSRRPQAKVIAQAAE
ncbi:MAG: hypothetical protein ACKVY0_25105 [Prosthecobacter sp.]|uniref:hypothetical protein n=1 Tax=Prosthecobacter sp. TaxID=1965333 RepID=UPI0038FE6332